MALITCVNAQRADAADQAQAEHFALIQLGGPGEDGCVDVAIAPDGGRVVAGYCSGTVDLDPGAGTVSHTSAGSIDIFLVKLDAAGKHLWSITMGGTLPDMPRAIACDRDGAIYLTGFFSGVADFDPGPGVKPLRSQGARDVFVAKYSVDGLLQWCIGFGGEQADLGADVAPDGNGGCYVTGMVQGLVDLDTRPGSILAAALGGMDGFVLHLDRGGQFTWGTLLGAAGEDQGTAIVTAADGGAVVGGYFSETGRFSADRGAPTARSAGRRDVFVARYAPDGALRWVSSFGGTGDDYLGGLDVAASGEIALAGKFQTRARFGQHLAVTSSGGDDVFIARCNERGEATAAFSIGGRKGDGSHRIAFDSAGGVYVTGWFRDRADLDPSDGEAICVATSDPKQATGAPDAFVAHYDAAGRYLGAASFGSEQSFSPLSTETVGGASATGLAIDPSGVCHVAGRFTLTTDFDPTDRLETGTSAGAGDGFLLALPPARLKDAGNDSPSPAPPRRLTP